MKVYPRYYKDFKCIANKCKHNCCIGWEIDIDECTYEFYKSIKGDFGKRLSDFISTEDTPHFILQKDERCPFLNDNNLCDIITTLGENALCDICDLHPRFNNELPDRIECGLGLCCEEACRLIITNKEKTTLLCDTDIKTDDEIIILRDEVIDTLQNREFKLQDRIDNMLKLCGTGYVKRSLVEYAEILLSLEILDDEWKKTLSVIESDVSNQDINSFLKYMNDREHEFEQLCVYLIYRHFANSPDVICARDRARFTAFAFDFFCKLGAYSLKNTGSYATPLHLDLVRMFSAEIEYSDENIYTLYDIL